MTIVLVHGAWHGGWCWRALVPLLEARGHRVLAPDLPGHGDDPTPASAVTMDAYVAAVCALLDDVHEPVLLVGHSMGGMLISAVAEQLPQQVAGLVYLCAFLPQAAAGDSLQAMAGLGGTAIRFAAGPEEGTVVVPEEVRDQAFYADCSSADRAFAAARLCPQPVAPFGATPSLGAAYAGVPKAYVECPQDAAIPIDLQRALQARQACVRVESVDAAHSPFFSQPDALAQTLDDLAADAGWRSA